MFGDDLEHGSDYFIDYYAFLGVARDADTDSIKKAFQAKVREYHPDVVSRAGDEIQKYAAKKTQIAILARDTLSDPESHAEYDQKLENWTGPISDDGEARIEEWDLSELQSILPKHDETTFNALEIAYDSAPDPNSPIGIAFRSALEEKGSQLELDHASDFSDLGLENPFGGMNDLFPIRDPEESIPRIFDNLRKKVETADPKEFLALQSKETRLLTGPDGEIVAGEEGVDALVVRQREYVLAKLDEARPDLERDRIAQQKVTNRRYELTQGQYVPADQPLQPKLLIQFLKLKGKVDDNEQRTYAVYCLDPETGAPGLDPRMQVPEFMTAMVENGDSVDEAVWIQDGYSVMHARFSFRLNGGISMMNVVNKHFDAFKKSQEDDNDE